MNLYGILVCILFASVSGYSVNGKASVVSLEGGLCSFPNDIFPIRAAIGRKWYSQATMCGACLQVNSSQETTLAYVTDKCIDCSDTDLSLNMEGFAKLKTSIDQQLLINWTIVPCPEKFMMIRWIEVGEYFTSFQILHHKEPINRAEFKLPDGTWALLLRKEDNVFEAPKLEAKVISSFEVRVIGLSGELLFLTQLNPTKVGTVATQHQFGSTPSIIPLPKEDEVKPTISSNSFKVSPFNIFPIFLLIAFLPQHDQ
ncbi:hypothetical protein DSO57_1033444 [Entomophthora muscae]|uniref:Uncharacterized protein n=2 Tax=Entomophthora muscae TaxID=34485 RepID=A0ACC2S273_9FUNG|nr:hypothetical protein DSO57_1033444 [Entomophthora muscae]